MDQLFGIFILFIQSFTAVQMFRYIVALLFIESLFCMILNGRL